MPVKKKERTKRSVGKRARTKGNSFELTAAKMLTEWSGYEHKRVPLSGGWQKNIVSGDIFCCAEHDVSSSNTNICVPFSWECKNQERWDLATLFKPDADKNIIGQFWDQTVNDSKMNQKIPALIFTRNYQPIFFMILLSTANKLAKLIGTSYKNISHMIHTMPNNDKIIMLTFADFLEWAPFETVLKLSE